MAILNQKRILNLIPKTSAPVTIHVSQGDVGTEIEFTLVKGDELFVNTGSLSASVHGVREDGANFGVFTCTLSGSSVKFPLHAEMTAVKGSAIAEIVLVDSQGNKVGSSNFGIMVEESVFPLGVTYDNDVSVYESILAYVQTIPAQVEADFNTAIAQEASTRSSQIQTLTNEVSSQNAALAQEVTNRAAADANLQTQIDELVAPSGEAPSVAEVENARIGANSITYPTLGASIRTQNRMLAKKINSAFDGSYNITADDCILGYYNASAVFIPASSYHCTKLTDLSGIQSITAVVVQSNIATIIGIKSDDTIEVKAATSGTHIVEVYNYKEVYINLWTTDFVTSVVINAKKLANDADVQNIYENIGKTKNLFDYKNVYVGKTYAPHGNLVTNANMVSSKIVPIKSNTDYVIKPSNSFWDAVLLDENGSVLNYLRSNRDGWINTFNSGSAKYIGISAAYPSALGFVMMEGSSVDRFYPFTNLDSEDEYFGLKESEAHVNTKYRILPKIYYVGLDGSGQEVVADFSCSTEFFVVPKTFAKFKVTSTNGKIVIFGYDENKNFIKSNGAWVTELEWNNDCAYYRITYGYDAISYYGLGDETWKHALFYDVVTIECDLYTREETYDFGKKGYEAGWIHFTVPVNTHIADLSDTSKALVDDETIVDVDCILKLPESYTATGEATKVIMITHGAGRGVWTKFGDQEPWKNIETYNALVDTFVDAGYAVFDCSGYGNDAYGVNFWGCPRGLQAWYKAYEYVEKYYNVTPKIGLYGFSMGGCTAFNLINKAFPNIACVGLGSPVTNLAQDQVSNMGYFLQAYGMGNTYDASKVVGYNPLENIVEIDNEEYCFKTLPPIKVWFGANETWPAPSDAQRLCNAIKKGGGVVEYRSVDDAGHEVCYGGIPAINTEILYWFNRFSYSEDE